MRSPFSFNNRRTLSRESLPAGVRQALLAKHAEGDKANGLRASHGARQTGHPPHDQSRATRP